MAILQCECFTTPSTRHDSNIPPYQPRHPACTDAGRGATADGDPRYAVAQHCHYRARGAAAHTTTHEHGQERDPRYSYARPARAGATVRRVRLTRNTHATRHKCVHAPPATYTHWTHFFASHWPSRSPPSLSHTHTIFIPWSAYVTHTPRNAAQRTRTRALRGADQ